MAVKPPAERPKRTAKGAKMGRPMAPPKPHMVSTNDEPIRELSAMAVAGLMRCTVQQVQ
jgi:hypothetical protein